MTQQMSKLENQADQNMFGKAASAVDGFFAKGFYRVGLIVGTRPCTAIAVTILFCLVCMGGFSQMNSETRADKLWIPQNTQAQDDQKVFNSYFPPFSRMNMILMEAKSGSAVDKNVLTDAMSLHKDVADVTSGEDTLTTLCIPKPDEGHPCFISSILSMWDFDPAKLAADANPVATINAAGKTQEDLNNLLGDAVYDANGKLQSAKVLRSTYFMQSNREISGGGYSDPRGEDWEEALLDMLKCDTPKCDGDDCVCDYPSDSFTIYVQSQRSWSDVFGNVIRGDVGLINGAFVIMIVYVTLNLGGLCHKIRMRSLLALGALVSIVLAGAAGYGLAMWFQFDYTPVMSVMPFVLIGIGVDDSFVIINALDSVSTDLPVPERIAKALSHAGISIFVTSFTDFIAFAISVSSALPALSAFCMYAALCILMIFVLQITVFTAFATLDAGRIDAGLIDCCPCICKKGCPCCPTVPLEEAVTDGKDANQLCCSAPPSKGGRIGKCLETGLGPIVVKPPVAVALVLLSVGFAAVCAWQATLLDTEETQPKFVPDNSYLRLTLEKQDRYFGLLGTSFSIVTEGGDYFAAQDALSSIGSRLDLVGYVKPSSSDSFESWAESYRSANGVVANQEQYYAGLKAWLGGQGARFAKDIIWVDETDPQQGIRASRIHAELKAINKLVDDMIVVDDKKAVETLDNLRDAVSSWTDMPGGKALAYSYIFLTWETFRIIKREFFLSVGLCLAAVFVITMVLIAHPLTGFLVFASVLIVIVDILGVMKMWGLAIDSVTVIQLVVAVGLSVDYSAHIGHCFMTKAGSRAERVIATFGDVGVAVLNGGFSTFLAVMLLALSKSYVFRVLFQTFFLTVVFGLFHGMVVLPAALSLIGPMGYSGRTESEVSKVDPVKVGAAQSLESA